MTASSSPAPSNLNISVVIPLYNKSATVVRAINSALQQTLPPVDVLVIDDGSTDDSCAVVAGKFGDAVRLVRQHNAGPSAARNHGARLCKGDVLVFLDADDELLPRCLEEHAACFNSDERVELSLTSVSKRYADGHIAEEVLTQRTEADDSHFIRYRGLRTAGVINVAACAIAIKKELFDRIGGFDEQLRCWEITDFLMRANVAAQTVGLHRTVSVTVHELPSNSQFSRTSGLPDYRFRFATKIIQHLPEISEPWRTEMAIQAANIGYSFWDEGLIGEYQTLYSELAPLLGPEQRTSIPYKIYRFPKPILKALHWLRRIRA
jgi:glycosyltransferase involved in cell wall biosynthesis